MYTATYIVNINWKASYSYKPSQTIESGIT